MEEVNLQPASLLQNDTANFEGLHHFLPQPEGDYGETKSRILGCKEWGGRSALGRDWRQEACVAK